jgi:hypothetical protein
VQCTTLNWPDCPAGTIALSRAYSNHRKLKMRRYAMLVALEVNFALWIMIGCGIAEYLI